MPIRCGVAIYYTHWSCILNTEKIAQTTKKTKLIEWLND